MVIALERRQLAELSRTRLAVLQFARARPHAAFRPCPSLRSLGFCAGLIDLEHWLLPFALTIPGIALGLLFSIPLGLERLRDSALGAAAGFFGFLALEHIGRKIFKKEALGGGDKYLLAMIGAFLTYRSLLGVVFLASLQGALVGSILLALHGRAGPAPPPEDENKPLEAPPAPGADGEDDWRPGPTNLPFGPWLALGALEVMLLGPWLAERLPWRAMQILVSGG